MFLPKAFIFVTYQLPYPPTVPTSHKIPAGTSQRHPRCRAVRVPPRHHPCRSCLACAGVRITVCPRPQRGRRGEGSRRRVRHRPPTVCAGWGRCPHEQALIQRRPPPPPRLPAAIAWPFVARRLFPRAQAAPRSRLEHAQGPGFGLLPTAPSRRSRTGPQGLERRRAGGRGAVLHRAASHMYSRTGPSKKPACLHAAFPASAGTR